MRESDERVLMRKRERVCVLDGSEKRWRERMIKRELVTFRGFFLRPIPTHLTCETTTTLNFILSPSNAAVNFLTLLISIPILCHTKEHLPPSLPLSLLPIRTPALCFFATTFCPSLRISTHPTEQRTPLSLFTFEGHTQSLSLSKALIDPLYTTPNIQTAPLSLSCSTPSLSLKTRDSVVLKLHGSLSVVPVPFRLFRGLKAPFPSLSLSLSCKKRGRQKSYIFDFPICTHWL